MTEKTLTLYLAVNQAGDFLTSYDSADETVGELQSTYDCEAVRTMELQITVDLPQIEVIPVTVPALSQAPAEVSVS